MKLKLAKYVAKLLVQNGVTQCFSVTGGGAMHLNDGLGHDPGMHTLYMHHEQSCAIAAESYARIYNKPACLCVTTGPGGTNAITGVLGAWLDSIPMIVLSGQVRFDNTARWSGVGIRAMGDQEFDITRSISCMTKYSKMILDPMSIRKELEKCIYLAQTGRPGPCWLDIPVDVQGMMIEEDELEPFDEAAYLREQEVICTELDMQAAGLDALEEEKGRRPYAAADMEDLRLRESFLRQRYQRTAKHIAKDDPLIDEIIARIKQAKRPVFYTGNGLRIAGAEDLFLRAADRLGIPVVVGWNGVDIIPSAHPLRAGQPGGRGDRPGNFAVQNADLILAVGSRLNIRQVGYNFKTWARAAYTIVCDIDEEELKKPSVHIDVPVHADAAELLTALLARLDELGIRGHGNDYANTEKLCARGYGASGGGSFVFDGGEGLAGMNWLETCAYWQKRYAVYQDAYAAHGSDEPANLYEFFVRLSEQLAPGQVTVVGNGSACVAGGQAYVIKEGTRFISQDAVASMGYDLPAAIGACVACHEVDGEVCSIRYARAEELTKRAAEAVAAGYGRRTENGAVQEAEAAGKYAGQEDGVSAYGQAAADEAAAGSGAAKLYAGALEEAVLEDKAYALGELETARRDPYWKGRHESYPDYYAHDIICPTGDGSIMMNLQELQTIASHHMPIKIFLVNNGGYHSIRQTQHNLFDGEPLVGIGVDSLDLSFPDFEKIAAAFGIPFVRAMHNTELHDAVQKTLSIEGPAFCEVVVSIDQNFEPKSATRKLADGRLVSPPLEDLAPFLSDEELAQNMIIGSLRE